MTRIPRAQLDRDAQMLEALGGGEYGPGFYNAPAILEAERNSGFSVADGILGWILNTSPDGKRRDRTLAIAQTMAGKLVTREVASMCHNVHAILAEFLLTAGIPAVSLWGSLHAEAPGEYLEFTLSPYLPRRSEDHRPGHSWVVTPDIDVLDVALSHQADVHQNYDELRERIPGVVAGIGRKSETPRDQWIAPAERTMLLPEERADALMYWDVLGWTEVKLEGLVLRYVPSAVQIPDTDWNFFSSLPPIGGMNPGRFIRKHLKNLLKESAT